MTEIMAMSTVNSLASHCHQCNVFSRLEVGVASWMEESECVDEKKAFSGRVSISCGRCPLDNWKVS